MMGKNAAAVTLLPDFLAEIRKIQQSERKQIDYPTPTI